METQKISKEMLSSFIQDAANRIKQELKEEYEKVGDPIDVKLNQNDGLGDTEAKNYTKPGKEAKNLPKDFEKEGDPVEDVKMNQEPSKEGSDEKIATAVEVEAGAEKGGSDVTAGQHKANFKSKTDGPKDSVSDPFTKKASDKMNKEDKVVDEGTKTFVEAGAEKGGSDVTAGQSKANWKEAAPKSDKDDRIAKGIQLKESYTSTELKQFIQEEAKKLAKKQMLQLEMQKLKEQISKI